MLAADLLNLPLHVGQRAVTFRFDLIDGPTGVNRGILTPLRDSPPSLSHDTTSTISRRVSGLMLGVADAALIDPLRDRVEISMVLGDPAATTYPLGRYMVADDIQQQTSSGSIRPLTLFDEMFIIDQKLTAAFDARGQLVNQAVPRLLDGLPIGDLVIDSTDQTCTNGWSAGTSRATALIDMAKVGGYFKPWFTHGNQLRVLRAFEPASQVPDINLDDPPRVLRDSISRISDLPAAKNRFVVISNSVSDASAAPVVGTYDVPSSAPYSIAQRGFAIPEVLDAQVSSATQAQVYARTIGLQQAIYERIELTTAPDPRHDGYDVVLFDGVLWLETGWAMTLTPGGAMRHTMRRAYPGTFEDEPL